PKIARKSAGSWWLQVKNSDTNSATAPINISQSATTSRSSLLTRSWCGLRRLEVAGQLLASLHVQEGDRGCDPAGECRQQVNPDVTPLEDAHHAGAERHRGIERPAGDRADRERAGGHREADRQPVERVPLG